MVILEMLMMLKKQKIVSSREKKNSKLAVSRPLTFTSRARGSARAMGFAVEEPLQPFMGRKERRRSSAGKLFLGGTTHPHRARASRSAHEHI